MDLIQRSFQLRWPILLIEIVFLIGGLILITSGYKIRKQSKLSAVVSVITGIIITLVSIYTLYYTIIFGYNS